MHLDVVTFINLQTVNLHFSFVNLFAFVCELVCICVWIFETLLTWLDSRMQGVPCIHECKELSVANQMPQCLPRFQPIT